MSQIVVGSVSNNDPSVNTYVRLNTTLQFGPITPANIITTGCTAKKLYVTTQAPGTGEITNVTLFVNGVATTLEVNVNDLELSGADITHTVTLNPADVIYFRLHRTGGSLSTVVNISFELD